MTDAPEPVVATARPDPAPYYRAKVIAARNRVVGLLLGFLAVLFFAITIVKMKL